MKVKDILETLDICTNVLILKRRNIAQILKHENITQAILSKDIFKAKIIACDDADNMLHGALSDDVLDLEVHVMSVKIHENVPFLEICIEVDDIEQ